MPTEDPYTPPVAAVEDPAAPNAPVRLGHLVRWGLLLFVVVTLIYIAGGFFESDWQPDGRSQWRVVLRYLLPDMVASIATFALYQVFLRRTASRQFAQLLGVFLIPQIAGLPLIVAMGQVPYGDAESLLTLGWQLVVCLLAYAAWIFSVRKAGR